MAKRIEAKKKKKKWFSLLATREFGNQEIGEAPAYEPNDLIGKNVNLSLANLTGDMKKQNIKLNFRVSEIKDNKIITEIIRYELVNSFVRRVVKRARSKLEESFPCVTKDDVKVRVKCLILTKAKTKSSILKVIRTKTTEFLIDSLKKQTYTEIINQLITHNIQRKLKESLKKIYPVAFSEIRVFERIK